MWTSISISIMLVPAHTETEIFASCVRLSTNAVLVELLWKGPTDDDDIFCWPLKCLFGHRCV
jgi:hypothetical protein